MDRPEEVPAADRVYPLTRIRLPFRVPYYAQVASPDWISRFFDDGVDPEQDPRWAESGAETSLEYAYWASRACGMACVKMVIEAFGGPSRSLMDWVRLGVKKNGYRIKTGSDGAARELGWSHETLKAMLDDCGLSAVCRKATIGELITSLLQNRLAIASVSYELGTHKPVTLCAGHLVVVTGADCQDETAVSIRIHNPSGRTRALREEAAIPAQRFAQAFSGRVILCSKPEDGNALDPSEEETD